MGLHIKSFLLCIFINSAIQYALADYKIVCYFGGWTPYRPGDGKFEIENIDPKLCTHLMYAFVGLSDFSRIRVLDPWQDLPDNGGRDGFGRFNRLKNQNPNLKTMLVIGGWNEGSVKYSQLLGVAENRKTFVDDAVNFLKTYGFDGLDFNWQYPNQRGGVPADVETFSALSRELRNEFDKHGLIISATVPAAESSFSISYNVPEINRNLHFINVMSYSFHGSWEGITGYNSPLFKSQSDIGLPTEGWNVDSSIKAWISYGASPEKLVLGAPIYSTTFTLRDLNCFTSKCPSTGPGIAGQWTGEPGILGYHEICLKEKQTGSIKYWDSEVLLPYMVNGNQWMSYDDKESLKYKMDYIKKTNLGGAMIWSIDTDDFRNLCQDGRYPLLTTIYEELSGSSPSTTTSQTTPTPSPTTPTTPTPSPTTPSPTPTTPPTSTTPGSHDVCKHEGYNRDPHDCSVFYLCFLANGEYLYTRYQCEEGLYFDLIYNVCNFKELVNCPADQKNHV